MSRPEDLLSQPLDSQGNVNVFDYRLPEISKFRAWGERFVSWLSGWDTDESNWTWKGAKGGGIEHEPFFKEFKEAFSEHPQTKSYLTDALRKAYT